MILHFCFLPLQKKEVDMKYELIICLFATMYSADGRTLLKGANVEGAYWIPEGVEEIEPEALIRCRIGTLHIPWTAHVHEYG